MVHQLKEMCPCSVEEAQACLEANNWLIENACMDMLDNPGKFRKNTTTNAQSQRAIPAATS